MSILGRFFIDMNAAQAAAFKTRFLAAADDAVDLFAARVDELAGIGGDHFDYTVDSLPQIFDAAASAWRRSDADPWGWAAGPLPVWSEHSSFPIQRLWILDGWMHYYSRIVERAGPLWWDWEHDQDLDSANQPVLVGFRSNMRLAPFVQSATVFVNSVRKALPEAVTRSVNQWIDLVPTPGEGPYPPEWFDGFTEQDVKVMVAPADRVNEAAVWPHKPGDFAAAWRTDLVEGVDAVLGRGSTEQLLEHIQSQSEVEAAAHGDEDELVVRAPTVGARTMQGIVLGWLNRRWAETKGMPRKT